MWPRLKPNSSESLRDGPTPLPRPGARKGAARPDTCRGCAEGLPWMTRNWGGSPQLPGAEKRCSWCVVRVTSPQPLVTPPRAERASQMQRIANGTWAEGRGAAGQRGRNGWRWKARAGGRWWLWRLGLDTRGRNGVPIPTFPDPDRGSTGSSVKVPRQWPQEGVLFLAPLLRCTYLLRPHSCVVCREFDTHVLCSQNSAGGHTNSRPDNFLIHVYQDKVPDGQT